MANGNGKWLNGNLSTVISILVILSMIIGATITFANKADKIEIKACRTELRTEFKEGDRVLHQRVNKVEDQVAQECAELKALIKENQHEIIEMLKKR